MKRTVVTFAQQRVLLLVQVWQEHNPMLQMQLIAHKQRT